MRSNKKGENLKLEILILRLKGNLNNKKNRVLITVIKSH